MSGGSFNYLYIKDLSDLMHYGFGYDWDAMLEELDELCPEAATEMRKIQLESKRFIAEHETRWENLQKVLHAVEWWRSSDWGKDQVDEVITEYRMTVT